MDSSGSFKNKLNKLYFINVYQFENTTQDHLEILSFAEFIGNENVIF